MWTGEVIIVKKSRNISIRSLNTFERRIKINLELLNKLQ